MDEYTDFTGAEVQEAAEPEAVETETAEIEETETGAEVAEAAEPQEQETRKTEADAAFAELRRRAEMSERRTAEASQRLARMTDVLRKLGFNGRDEDDVTDDAIAHMTESTVEQVRQQRMSEQYASRQRQALIDELNALRDRETQRTVDDDMRVFKSIDPSLKSEADLVQKYPAFLKTVQGLSPEAKADAGVRELLFRAEYERQQAKAVKAPPKVGKVNAKTSVEKEYFSNKELDNLTRKDLDDPKVLEKAIKSLTKISK